MNKKAANLVISITKRFIEYAQASTNEDWDEVFLRYQNDGDVTGVTCIYRAGNDSEYFRSDKKFDFYEAVENEFNRLREELVSETGKGFRVCLLRVDSGFDYNMYYEYKDSRRWEISKLDGQSGIPAID